MPDSLGIPDSTDLPMVSEGPAPETAGAGWAAVTHGLDQASALFGGVQQLLDAHQETVDANQLATIRSSIDTQQQKIAGANQYDAGAFSQQAGAARSDFIKALPGRYAQQAGQYWDLQSASNGRQIYGAGMARDHTLAVQGLQQRLSDVTTRMQGALQSGAPLATAMASPDVQNGLAEAASIRQSLVNSKAIAPEVAAADEADTAKNLKAAAFTGHLLSTFQTQGASAAIGELERLQHIPQAGETAAPGAWEAGQALTPDERALMGAKGRAALTSAISLQEQSTNLAQAQVTAASKVLDNRTQNSLAQVELNGRPDPSLVQADFAAVPGGQAKYVQYLHDLSDRMDKHATAGDLGTYASPQAAAEHLSSVGDLKDLPQQLGTEEGLTGFMRGIRLAETGTNPAQISPKGAVGAYQLLPATARAEAARLGIPYDQDRLLHDPAYNETLARSYITNVLAPKYAGDPFLTSFAYHAGPGVTDRMVQRFGLPTPDTQGQWLQEVKAAGFPASAAYPVTVANAAKGGKAWAAFDQVNGQSQWAIARAGNVEDPLNYARLHGRADIQPLPTNGFSGSPQVVAQWGAGLKQRQAVGQTLAQSQGVPPRILTNAEASSYRDQIRSDPTLGPRIATAAAGALGAQGAVSLMHEIGQTDGQASVGVQTGLIAASSPAGARFAGSVNDGLQARAQGAKDAPLPHGVTWEKVQASVAPAFAQMGAGSMAAVMQTAQLAHLGEAQKGAPAPPEAYVRSALGGATNPRTGEQFGGVAPVNGLPTLHPTWLKVGTMPTAMHDLAAAGRLGGDPPVYTNGQPMRPQDIARMRPQALPNGHYVLRDPRTDQFARTRGGAPYELDMEAAKPFLSGRGGYVLSGG